MPESKQIGPMERALRRMVGLPIPDPEPVPDPVPDQGNQKKEPKEREVK